jgi:hypothetical protein
MPDMAGFGRLARSCRSVRVTLGGTLEWVRVLSRGDLGSPLSNVSAMVTPVGHPWTREVGRIRISAVARAG